MVTLTSTRTRARRRVSGVAADPHVLLALALVFAALAVELVSGLDPRPAMIPIVLYLVIQVTVTLVRSGRRRSEAFDTARLLLAVGAVVALTLRSGEVVALPLTALYIPIVAIAAAIGWWPTAIVGSAAFGWRRPSAGAVLRLAPSFGLVPSVATRLRS